MFFDGNYRKIMMMITAFYHGKDKFMVATDRQIT
jgi:hypothetical protein